MNTGSIGGGAHFPVRGVYEGPVGNPVGNIVSSTPPPTSEFDPLDGFQAELMNWENGLYATPPTFPSKKDIDSLKSRYGEWYEQMRKNPEFKQLQPTLGRIYDALEFLSQSPPPDAPSYCSSLDTALGCIEGVKRYNLLPADKKSDLMLTIIVRKYELNSLCKTLDHFASKDLKSLSELRTKIRSVSQEFAEAIGKVYPPFGGQQDFKAAILNWSYRLTNPRITRESMIEDLKNLTINLDGAYNAILSPK